MAGVSLSTLSPNSVSARALGCSARQQQHVELNVKVADVIQNQGQNCRVLSSKKMGKQDLVALSKPITLCEIKTF